MTSSLVPRCIVIVEGISPSRQSSIEDTSLLVMMRSSLHLSHSIAVARSVRPLVVEPMDRVCLWLKMLQALALQMGSPSTMMVSLIGWVTVGWRLVMTRTMIPPPLSLSLHLPLTHHPPFLLPAIPRSTSST
jgi:hypothetical protein